MHDDFLRSEWAEHHGAVSSLLAELIEETRFAFERLAARTYDAPWKHEAHTGLCSGAGNDG
ncbi:MULTISPECIES: hypothetical protein [unclassified Sphingomonas]|uniref:hypothetical protein n=1 Tax=unclassified Sphingomonas TaxID=196159 RepID=UPI002269B846|nr:MULTISPECIES: hypothetical protein [unclassified Sphingomonas]